MAPRVVAKHLEEDAGRDLALRIGYPDQRLDTLPEIAAQRLTISDAALYATMVGFGWGKDSIGVALSDGVGEIELASVFDVYPGQLFAADVTTLSAAGPKVAVTSRHGLTFIPRHGLDDAPTPDRVIVPGLDVGSETAVHFTSGRVIAVSSRTTSMPTLRDGSRSTPRCLTWPTSRASLRPNSMRRPSSTRPTTST